MFWDTHTHTHFSSDSKAIPENMIQAAQQKGLAGICFTDHLDLDFPGEPGLYQLDLPAYTSYMKELCETFSNQKPEKQTHFSVGMGIELGIQHHIAEELKEIVSAYDFDFVIASSHLANGKDPYEAEFYYGRTEEAAYEEYFLSILKNLSVFEDFDVYGHIDYVVRYGPNKNKFYSYRKYADIIDEILKKLISMGKGIEINTAGFKYGLSHPHPTEEIIKRYRELGGEIITTGSDGHAPEHLAYEFSKIPVILQKAGFRYFTVFQKRKPVFFSLET